MNGITIQKAKKEAIKTPLRLLPKGWVQVIGILKGKRIDPFRYQRMIRKGWAKAR